MRFEQKDSLEDEEDEIDFDELSREYPIFFSQGKSLPRNHLQPNPKSPKPISNDPNYFLDYDEYMLNDKITNLEYLEVDEKEEKRRPKSSKSLNSQEPNLNSNPKHRTHFASPKRKKPKLHPLILEERNQKAKAAKERTQKNNETEIIDLKIYREVGIQTPKSLNKKKVFSPPPPAIPQLHSGYKIELDYEPKFPQKSQVLLSGTQKINYRNGDVSYHYLNGKVKIYHQNNVITRYKNGDILQEFPDGATAYKYSHSGTIELKLPNGTRVLEFANGQREKTTPEGETTVKFKNGMFMKLEAEGNWTMVKNANNH